MHKNYGEVLDGGIRQLKSEIFDVVWRWIRGLDQRGVVLCLVNNFWFRIFTDTRNYELEAFGVPVNIKWNKLDWSGVEL